MTHPLEIRVAASEAEAFHAQMLDSRTWDRGYKKYVEHWKRYPESLLVAAVSGENSTTHFPVGTVVGFVSVERIHESDLRVGMPPWDHPLEFHKPDGNVWYILGLAVRPELMKEGVGPRLMTELIRRAYEVSGIDMLTVIYNLRHPTLPNPRKWWGRFNFKPMLHTYDPDWKHSPDAEKEDGAILWSLRIRWPGDISEIL